MAGRSSSRRYAPSFLVGLLVVPLSAVAAYALMSSGTPEAEAETAATTITTMAAVQPVGATVGTTTTTAVSRADLEAACGPDGQFLVAVEAAGTITDLEQAALDALRPICAEAGLALDDPPAPPPVVHTVTVSNGAGQVAVDDSGQSNPGVVFEDHEAEERYESEDHPEAEDHQENEIHHEDDD